jgi:hypothetical protein
MRPWLILILIATCYAAAWFGDISPTYVNSLSTDSTPTTTDTLLVRDATTGTMKKATAWGVIQSGILIVAGTPASGFCDEDTERGRLAIDTSNNLLYVCNGQSRGWDTITLN